MCCASAEGNPGIAFSGGEPLVRADIAELVHFARQLNYKPISLFTNSMQLPGKEEILDNVDYLQISLDTLDTELQDRLCGRPGTGHQIIANVQRYAALQRQKHFRLNINCVLCPETFGSVKDLLRFAADTKVRFTVSPQLDEDGQPADFFRDATMLRQYQESIDTILSYKRLTDVVLDTVPFLQHLRELRTGPCYPMLTPRIYPDGSLRFPCSIVCRSARSVSEVGSWEEIVNGLNSVPTECSAPCLLPCYLQTSLVTQHPLVLLQEFR